MEGPKDHIQNCYFCLVNVKEFSRKHRMKILYPNLDSVQRPVLHDVSMPGPLLPKNGLDTLADEVEEDSDERSTSAPKDSTDSDYDPEKSSKLILFSQEHLKNLLRDLTLSKRKAELLASRLPENNLLHADVVVSHYRKRNMDLSTVFRVDGPLCCCHNFKNLFEKLGEDHIAIEWRLFLDSSKRSLKAVLLHNGNTKPSVPAAHSMHLKES